MSGYINPIKPEVSLKAILLETNLDMNINSDPASSQFLSL